MQKIDSELWQEFETELKKSEKIQIEFPKGLNITQHQTLDDFFKLFLDEKFPEGQINKTLEKNFAVYIVQNKLDIQKIKEKYYSQNWNVGGLLGWIKKVTTGEITELNIGELVNWAKENKPELVEKFGDISKIELTEVLRRADLKFHYEHLPHFEKLASLTQIFGDEYQHLKKILFYHLVAGQIPEHLKIVRLGQIEIDLRDYLFLVFPSGSAKGNVKNLILKLKRELGQEAISLTSMHEEQLIGKIIKRKEQVEDGFKRDGTRKYKTKEVFIQNHGHFIADEILIDECKNLLLDRDKEISRNYLLIAMDKYKQNEIYKRLTENLNNSEESLRYFPKFNAMFGTQPFNYHENNIVLNGFLKRVTTDYIPLMNRPDEIFSARLKDKTPLSQNFEETINFLAEIKNIQQAEWGFEESFEEKFIECFQMLRGAGLYNSRKKRNYTKLVEWQLQDRLLRKTCLFAIAKDKTTYLKPEHIELAFLDCLEDFIIELEFVNDKIYGDLDYGSVWGTTNQKDKNLLTWLYKKKAVSEEKSNVSIQQFQEYIMDETGLSKEGARKKYYKLVENGLINSKQFFQGETKVWLVNNPQGGKGDQGGNVYSKKYYVNLIQKYFSTTGTPLPPLPPLNKKGEESNANDN